MNVIDILPSMYSTVETSPVVNVGVFEQTFSVYLRFGHRLFLHMTPAEAEKVAIAVEARSLEFTSIDLTTAFGGYVRVKWISEDERVRLQFGIGGAAFAIFDEHEAKALTAAIRTCATVARDLLGEST